MKVGSSWRKLTAARSPLDLSRMFDEADSLSKLREALQADHEKAIAELNDAIARAHQIGEHMLTIQKGEPGEPGAPGLTPIKGKHYFDGKPGLPGTDGEDGKPGKPGAPGRDGSDAVIDHDQLATSVIKHIKKEKLLKKEDIDGLEADIATIRNHAALSGKQYGKDTFVRGGGDTVAAGSGVSIINANGVKTISATGSAAWTRGEQITLQADSKTFTLSKAPTAVLNLTLDRQIQIPTLDYTGTINGSNKTFAFVSAVDPSLQSLIYGDYS